MIYHLSLMSESDSGLQNCLDKVSNYCETKVMIFTVRKKDYSEYNFHFNDSVIDIVEKYKYLGIVFFFNGKLMHAVNDLYNKSIKSFFSLRNKFSNFESAPPEYMY